jgi:uncharacterized protein DUF4339
MTGQQPDIQWYIARDGKQHGPLSDIEMRTFVAQGHLKPTDLIWRAGFADWRPAPAVFPFQSPEPAAPPAPRAPAASPASARPAPTGRALSPSPMTPERSFEPNRIRAAKDDSGGQGPSRVGRAVGILLLMALLGGAGWYVWQQGGLDLGGTQTADTNDTANDSSSGGLARGPDSAALTSDDVEQGAQALDAKFQRTPMWSVVKREFPDWYGDRLREAAKLSAENKPELEITKHLAESLVALRRKHAQQALSASTDKLKGVANAFLNNLKTLGKRSVTACYGFISQGETAPVVLELLQSPSEGAAMRAQVAAIFEAIADGRNSPTTHEPAVKSDYEILVQQLTKLGWEEGDLKTFSNPSALSKEPPERVCKMVQDWFMAHLSVEDQATQERLLVETLKPVVSG